MYRLGIDLGGTKIEGAILNGTGEPIFRERFATEQEKGYEHILSQIKRLYDSMVEKIKSKPHSLGMGTPGAISHRTGALKNSNTECLRGRFSTGAVEKLLGHKVLLENDANCFALAESLRGAAKGKDLVFGVIMGTGCGCGMVYQGKLLVGRQDIAGEWGHMSIDPNGPPCYCGARGCVETFISGGGLEKRYTKQFSEKLVLSEIVSRYRKGDGRATKFMKEFFIHFGRSVANLINILDPDVIVLGGGVSNIKEIYTEGIEEVRRQVFSDSLETPIVKNKLGDSAGVIGAAPTSRYRPNERPTGAWPNGAALLGIS